MDGNNIINESKRILDSVPEEDAKNLGGRPRKREKAYRVSLYLDEELERYIKWAAWRERPVNGNPSINQYFNDLVRKDRERYLAQGGSESEWE